MAGAASAELLPAAVVDYVPADHLAQFVVALAREHLDLSEIVASYKSGLGQPPFDSRMMTALLLYADRSGLYSSRRIAKACAERVDFMMIVAHDAPDFRTIADFRKRHLPPLGRLFLQVLKLAEKAGLAKLGHVALDGTKIKANASKHKAMSYERMKTRETQLRAQVDRWLEAAEAADAQEDKLHGASRRGDEMPGWIADKQKRLAKIREAREALEAEAAAAAAAKAEAERAAEEKRKAEDRKRSGPVPRPPSKEPDPKVQRNFTDPDSRVLLTKDGFIQGYNAQAAVDGAKQIIVAHGLTQSMSDCPQLVPLVDAVRANLGRKPREISADAGYCSEDNLLALATRKCHSLSCLTKLYPWNFIMCRHDRSPLVGIDLLSKTLKITPFTRDEPLILLLGKDVRKLTIQPRRLSLVSRRHGERPRATPRANHKSTPKLVSVPMARKTPRD